MGDQEETEYIRKGNMNGDILRLLECPICFEHMTSPIYCCMLYSHLICDKCVEKVKLCPQCQSKLLPKRRNSFAEDIAALIQFPCEYVVNGCKVIGVPTEIAEHVKKCPYNTQDCSNKPQESKNDRKTEEKISARKRPLRNDVDNRTRKRLNFSTLQHARTTRTSQTLKKPSSSRLSRVRSSGLSLIRSNVRNTSKSNSHLGLSEPAYVEVQSLNGYAENSAHQVNTSSNPAIFSSSGSFNISQHNPNTGVFHGTSKLLYNDTYLSDTGKQNGFEFPSQQSVPSQVSNLPQSTRLSSKVKKQSSATMRNGAGSRNLHSQSRRSGYTNINKYQ